MTSRDAGEDEARRARRLHPLGAVLFAARTLWGLWPLLIAALLNDSRVPLFGFLLGALPLVLGLGVLSWWRFVYRIERDELRIERGLFVRKRIFIPRERIQAVEISAGLAQRLFGLVRVRIKTEAAELQAELAAVSRAEAQRLEQFLAPTASAAPRAPREVQRRWTLSTGQLVLAASTSGRIGALLTLLGWLYAQFNELVDPWLHAQTRRGLDLDAVGIGTPTLLAMLAVAALLVSWLASIVAEVVRYGGFGIERRADDSDTLVIARGLLERHETVLPRGRIHAVRIVEGLLRQPLGYATILADASGHAGERGQSTVLHPLLHRSQWRAFLDEVVPELALPDALETHLERPPPRARLRFFARPALVASVAAALGALFWTPGLWLTLALWGASLPMAWLAYRQTGVALLERRAVVRQRSFGRRITAITPRKRVQAAQASASWLQRRRRLASCHLVVASGAGARDLTARDLDEGQGARLLQWLRRR